jgi:triacylglycerol esterase/lipase EstA (alpha/beta hydrolase family)
MWHRRPPAEGGATPSGRRPGLRAGLAAPGRARQRTVAATIDSAGGGPYVAAVLRLVATLVAVAVAAFIAGIASFNVFTFVGAFARPPRPRGLALAFARELLANLLIIPALPLMALLGARYEARLEREPGRPHRRPVILLHGYLMNRTNWLWLGAWLARRGIGPLYGLSYLTVVGTDRGAEKLARFVEKLCRLEEVDRVDIVAHSLGGLVARHYIEALGGDRRVRRLLTIGTPHHGTSWARLAVGTARHDLSVARADARAGSAPPEGVLYTSIWSPCDNLVVPAESARIAPAAAGVAAGGVEDVVFEGLGHLSLLVSPRVASAVASRLAA